MPTNDPTAQISPVTFSFDTAIGPPGGFPVNSQNLGFTAWSVTIDNFSNQYVLEQNCGRTCSPALQSQTFRIPRGASTARATLTPPMGVTQTTPASGEVVITYFPEPHADSAGTPTNLAITPVGPAGGDLGGSYPNPTVVGWRGKSLKAGAAADAQLYLYNNANGDWELVSLSGDATVTNAGVVTTASRELGSATATAAQTVASTATPGTDLTGLTATVTPDGTHPVYVDFFLPTVTNNNGLQMFVAIQKDGAVVQRYDFQFPNTQIGSLYGRFRDAAPTNAAHTYKLSAWSGGVQNITVLTNSSAVEVGTLTVMQIGT